MLVIMR